MDQYYNISTEESSKFVTVLKRLGIAKTTNQANYILAIIGILCIALAITIMWVRLYSIPTANYSQLPDSIKKALPGYGMQAKP
jgi:hypothetical protein